MARLGAHKASSGLTAATSDEVSRIFFALWPDTDTCASLDLISEQLPKGQGRRIVNENLHITLSFIGNVNKEQMQAYSEAAASVNSAPFELVLDRVGYFARAGVLWVGGDQMPPELNALVARLNKALCEHGYKSEARLYTPHVTLLRKARPLAQAVKIEPVNWSVNGFALVESVIRETPVKYQLLREYEFVS